MSNEIFDSSVRSAGDLAGLFEYDGETGYFYLSETKGAEAQKVIDSIHIVTGEIDFGEADIQIRWDALEQDVALFIRNKLWAVFDTVKKSKSGGGYIAGKEPPSVPDKAFSTH